MEHQPSSDDAVRTCAEGDVANSEGLQDLAVRIGGDVAEISDMPVRSAHATVLRSSWIEMPAGTAAVARRTVSAIVDMQPVHGIRFETGHVQIDHGHAARSHKCRYTVH